MSDNNASEKDVEKTKPEDTDFRQQRLRAWQPLLTPKWVIITFFIIGVIFLPLGLGILVTSNDVVEIDARYDNLSCDISTETTPCNKTVSLTFPSDVDGPVYFYYKLTNFYQNHRRYVQSRADSQLAGEGGSTSACDPLESYDDKVLYPCGLIANSVFRDTFSAGYIPSGDTTPTYTLSGTEWDDSAIAWDSDRDTKFKDLYDPVTAEPLPSDMSRDAPSGTLPTLEDQHLMVWMRTAGIPSFRKLNRKVARSFSEGDQLQITVYDQFPVTDFDGTKTVVISTSSWIGGKNFFLAYAYIITGGICLFLGIAFLIKQFVAPRPLGEMKAVRKA